MGYFKEAPNTGLFKEKETGLEWKAQDENNAARYCQ